MRWIRGALFLFAFAVILGSLFLSATQFEWAADAAVQALTSFLEKFKDERFAPRLALGLVGGGVIVLVLVFLQHLLYARQLSAARNSLGPRDLAQFARNWDQANQKLERNKLVGAAWREFAETVDRTSETELFNAARPHTFINESLVATSNRMVASLPPLFVGIGLLLTFIGLLAALKFASGSIASGDLATSQKALQDLFNAATFKFWTSVSGLGASLVLTFFFKFFRGWTSGSIELLCDAIEERMTYQSAQVIARRQALSLESMLAEVKRFNTETAVAIGDRVGDRVVQGLPDALLPLVDQIGATVEQLRETSQRGVGEMVGEASKALETAAGAQLTSLAASLEETAKTLSSLREGLAKSAERMSESSTAAAQAFELVAERTTHAAEQITTAATNLGDSASPILAGITDLTRSSAETKDALTSSSQLLDRASEKTAEVAKALSIASERVEQSWSDYQSRFEKVDEDLGRTVDSLTTASKEGERSTLEFTERLDQSFDSAITKLDGAIARLGEQLEQISEATEEIASTMKSMRPGEA